VEGDVVAISIRGTGGSGKSTLVRRIMDLYAAKAPTHVEGRRQPEGYLLSDEGRRCLYVPGHYATPCGGCDTIKTPERVYELVREAVAMGCDVLYEGIIVQDDVRRAVELYQSNPPVHVIGLTTPVEVCLAAIGDRRTQRGDPRPLNPKNTTNRARTCERGLVRLEEAGVPVWRLDREAAFAKVRELLGV
jgi:thymidylate kinase